MAEVSEADVPLHAPPEAIDGGNAPSSPGGKNPASSGPPLSPAASSSYSTSSSSTSSSDSESESEAQQNLQLEALEAELSNNPADYDAHVQYIKCLRRQGHIDKLRRAREAMKELFPLPPVMWQEWAKDEISLATSRPEAYNTVEKLYEQGVSDYLSVDLWCDYLNFVQEYFLSVCEGSHEGLVKARNLFERAITATGLHIVEGNKIWEAFRHFEQAVFCTIDETDVEAKSKQVQRIQTIYHRQLSVPMFDMRSTLLAYKAWEVEQGSVLDANSDNLDGIASQVALAYQKALEMYNDRAHFEEQIAKHVASNADKIQKFMTYIKYEELSGDPARVQILYERAVSEFPISSDIWMDYTCYLDRTLKVGNVVTDVYSRAAKNCPWVGELWVRYLLSLERRIASEEEISAVFEKSLQCTFSSFDEYHNLFLTRIDGLRRRLSVVEVKDVLDYALIRDTFQRASDYLSPHLKNSDSLLNLYAYWARLEMDLGSDLASARRIWESLCKISGSRLEAWKGYIDMEIKLGHINEARAVYRRCYSKRLIGNGSEDICHSWICFEREHGSLDDFDHAVRKVTPRLDELRLFRAQQESKGIGALKNQKGNSLQGKPHDKRKEIPNPTDEQPFKKRKKNAVQNMASVPRKVSFQDQGVVKDGKAEEIKSEVNKPDNTNGLQKEESASKKTKIYTDQCTAFLSNLSFQANYEHLEKFFSDIGGVVEIRILKDKYTGKSRGLAYVEFSDEAHLAAAVAKNRKVFLGKKVSIARSDPSRKKNKGSTGHGASNEPGRRAEHPGNPKGRGRNVSDGKADIENMELKGKKAFAIPGPAKLLGDEEEGDDKPKSNDDFRNMFLKK